MASYSIAAGMQALHDITLVANTVDTVTLMEVVHSVEVMSDGSAVIYFTVDGTTPTIGGANGIKIPASGGVSVTEIDFLPVSGHDVAGQQVKLISAGTPVYDVTKVA